MISSLQPLFKSLLGSVLIGVLRLIKYSVIIGGVVLIIMVLTSNQLKQDVPSSTPQQREHLKDDFKPMGIDSLETTVRHNKKSSHTPETPHVTNGTSAAYESFIRRAG
ncbi:unnamed protein product [Kluyveromyces dobzhanskii CBS 2104]|uniref:WGS project CCBQ000000000 data, contig 00015 n=1 Tax=Kluyveromyces dobzhanskii CBS 2104 TaxID=1427455 RepID=A0A0A8LB09_9SACH|nr:unnamed protein product [Kluyveromyces dobzhanskii CBS 2104]